MKNILIVGIALFIATFTTLYSQMPVITNSKGDTIRYTYPPLPTSYLPNEIIIKFRSNALNLNLLCYGYGGETLIEQKKEKILGLPTYLRTLLLNQRFYVDDLIADSVLLVAIKSFGGDTLRRITVANPCADTISIARNGDTLFCDDFLWMVLQINNDSSVVNGSFLLTYFNQYAVEGAEPNYLKYLHKTPNDYLYTDQVSLHTNMIGIEKAWDFQTSNRAIKVGIIDNGIDYRHCDFGSNFGLNYKVVGGWNWTENDFQIWRLSNHGTPVSGIIGALTNRNCLSCNESVAGIAGGWGPNELGCQLFGFRVAGRGLMYDALVTDLCIAAIREGSANNPNTGYGYGVHILNNSYGDSIYSESERAAVNYAFEHGVSFVVSRGNSYYNEPQYPACFENEWVVNVGGSNRNRNKIGYSSYGNYMDFLAPGGKCDTEAPDYDPIIFTTDYAYDEMQYRCFSGTSASAPHVTGVIALLRSSALENNWDLEPEDYEGMIKASCLDRNPQNIYPVFDPEYKYYYDNISGWGHLQADNLYEMLFEKGYRISHIYYKPENISFGNWSSIERIGIIKNPRQSGEIRNGLYFFKRRWVSFNINLPANHWIINDEKKIYVWGRSGQWEANAYGTPNGLSLANPNYLSGYTQVNSGTGGNGFVDGIIHNQSLTVSVLTYQYAEYVYSDVFKDYFFISKIPYDEDIGANISVFGIPTPQFANYDIDNTNQIEANISPNPITDMAKISFNLGALSYIRISINNLYGCRIWESPTLFFDKGKHTFDLNFKDFINGVYLCNIVSNSSSKTLKFCILK